MGAFSDADGYTTRAQRAEMERALRQIAAVEKAMLMMRVREDFLRASHRMDEAKIAEACVFDIRTALETE